MTIPIAAAAAKRASAAGVKNCLNDLHLGARARQFVGCPTVALITLNIRG
jgi:hypothetical protein